MSDRKILNRDSIYGITEFFIPSEDGDSFTIAYEQDSDRVVSLLDRNKADFNEVNHHRWGDGKLVARIPGEIYADWHAKGYVRDQVKLKALLNDPDNRFMRTWPGVL